MKVNVGGLTASSASWLGRPCADRAGGRGNIGWWGYIGIVPLVTGLFRMCPLYSLIGVNTCPMNAPKS